MQRISCGPMRPIETNRPSALASPGPTSPDQASSTAARPPTPPDLDAAGYRIERGSPDDGDLAGLFWWTWCKGGAGVDASNDEWATADEAIADARAVEQHLHSGRHA